MKLNSTVDKESYSLFPWWCTEDRWQGSGERRMGGEGKETGMESVI